MEFRAIRLNKAQFFFQAVVVLILLYGCFTWTVTKCIERKIDGNYTQMQRTVLNKSWRQHLTKQKLYGYQQPISKTIQIRRARHEGHCWRSKGKLISDVLQWTSSHRRTKVGWLARTYLKQFCTDTGCSMEDLPRAMDDSDEWRERVTEILASGTL